MSLLLDPEIARAVGDTARFFISTAHRDQLSNRQFFRSCGWLDSLTETIPVQSEIISLCRGRPCFVRLKKVIRFGDNVFEDRPIDKIYLSYYKTGSYILSEDFEPLDIFKSTEDMLRKLPGYLRSYFP